MASSEHTLKLKAVLDVGQVRGQLNQIRNQANQVLGNQQQRLQNSGSAGTGNIAQLNVTLRNLQASIDRLNQAITRNFAYGKQPISTTSRGAPALAAAGAAAGRLGGLTANTLDNQYSTLQKLQASGRYSQAQIAAAQRQYIQNIVDAGPNLRAERRKLQNTALTKKILRRSLITYGISNLASAGEEYASATGHSGVGKALSFGNYVGVGAMAGSLGGPVGIALGAAVGTVSFALKELADSAKKTASALAESEQRIKSARQVQHGWLDFQRQRIDAEAAKRNDSAHFIQQQTIAKSEADLYRSQLESSDLGSADPAELKVFEEWTRKLVGGKQISPEQAAERNKMADQWKDTFAQMQKALQLADSYKEKVESIEKTNEKNLEAKQKELEAFEKQEGLAANLEKFVGNTAKLSDLAKTSKLNLDIAKGVYSSYLKSGDVSESGLDNLSTARTKMQQAQQEYQAYANALRQSEAADAQKAAAQAAQVLAAKQGELSDLQKHLGFLSAPNLDQVTSLASSGLMTSASYDQAVLQAQVHSAQEQTEIQRQILNKMDEIKELDNTATYS